MRTRIGWLALLLTAGMVLAPTGARGQNIYSGQDVGRADPVFPIPTYNPRPEMGGFFFYGEFIYWRETNPIGHQAIAFRGFQSTDAASPGPVGAFFGSGQVALDSEQVAGPGTYIPGYRIGGGYRFRSGLVFDLFYTHMFHVRYIAAATLLPQTFPGPGQLDPQLANTFLFSPVYNFSTDWAGANLAINVGNNPVGNFGIWNGASEMNLRFEQRLDRWEARWRVPVWETDYDPVENPNKLGLRCYGLTGLRHTWLWERFLWETVKRDANGLATPFDVAKYANILSQPMYGPFIGWGAEVYEGHGFALSLDVTAACYMDFIHSEIRWDRGDRGTEAKRSLKLFSVVPETEANLNLWWYPIEGVQIRVGYDVIGLFNTLYSPQPVDFNFGALAPAFPHKAARWIDGVHAGIGFIF